MALPQVTITSSLVHRNSSQMALGEIIHFASLLNHMQYFIDNGSFQHEEFTDLALLDFKCRLYHIIMHVNQIVLNYVKYYSAFNMQNMSFDVYFAEYVWYN